jgi:hypothetical protein
MILDVIPRAAFPGTPATRPRYRPPSARQDRHG